MRTIAIFALLTVTAICFTIQQNPQPEKNFQQKIEAIPWPFTLCGGEADWTIESVTLGNTPKRNTNNDIDVVDFYFMQTGTAKKPITFKRAEINVKLNGVYLDKEVIEFKDSYDTGDTVEFKYQNYVPSIAPSGTYSLVFQFFDSKETVNGCMQFQFKL